MKYAIQWKNSGQVIDYCEELSQAKWFQEHYEVEVLETSKVSHLSVYYAELGGPNGYGHSEESFATYGGYKRCIINFYKWVQETTRVFGPDARDIRDFFRHCSVEINGKNMTEKFLKQLEKLSIKELYV